MVESKEGPRVLLTSSGPQVPPQRSRHTVQEKIVDELEDMLDSISYGY